MRVDHRTRTGRLLIGLGALIARILLGAIFATCRIRVASGNDSLPDWHAADGGSIITIWHNRTVLAALFYRRLVPSTADLTILSSHSRDGALAARISEKWGFTVLRGSASRGGSGALRGLYRSLRRGSSALLLPDGPRGPLYRFKTGVVVLGAMARRPILPLGLAATRFWRLGSWDRMIIPKPFSEIVVTIEAPHVVARDLTDEELERERLALEEFLTRTTRAAEAVIGVEDDVAPLQQA